MSRSCVAEDKGSQFDHGGSTDRAEAHTEAGEHVRKFIKR